MTPAAHKGAHAIRIKRVYLPPDDEDGQRVLVDRLWPRGLGKSDAHFTSWLKDVAPSPELRKWFGHDPARWKEFRDRYTEELTSNPAVDSLRELCAKGDVTLLYAAHDEAHNHARVLAEFLGAKPK
jgi:uncharacterized protein YeaO (DUF488 family)